MEEEIDLPEDLSIPHKKVDEENPKTPKETVKPEKQPELSSKDLSTLQEKPDKKVVQEKSPKETVKPENQQELSAEDLSTPQEKPDKKIVQEKSPKETLKPGNQQDPEDLSTPQEKPNKKIDQEKSPKKPVEPENQQDSEDLSTPQEKVDQEKSPKKPVEPENQQDPEDLSTPLEKPDKKADEETVKPELSSEEYDPKNVHYEGETAIYTDPKSGYQYKWCNETNEWLPRSGVTYGFEDDTHTYTDADGVKYFWDKEKSAWFPKIDDDFMARYQMSYGFVDNTSEDKDDKEKPDVKKEAENVEEKPEKAKGAKRKPDGPPPPATWFEMDDQQNTKVYVSNLPTDITEEEFVDFMQKCGLVMRDAQTGKMKIKLYTVPETDILKGDALCTYIKIESVELALNLLDGYLYRGKRVSVERAKFQMKGEYNPSLKPKKKRRKDKDKVKKMQEKLFDWRPEKMRGERSKHERVVIVKNLFEPSLFDKDVSLILEFQQDLREECGKCGEVKRVVLYDRHPEGVVQITMKDPEEADEVVTLLNGRWFNKRQLTAEIWDGKTKFKIAETDAQISKRLETWEEFLESEEAADKLKSSSAKLPEQSSVNINVEGTVPPDKKTIPQTEINI